MLGNGSLYMWGRADFGKLGRSKSDAQTEPFLIEALWRREVAAGSTDKTKSLSKAEISELLEQRLDVHDILRYFPDIEADAEAALFLSKAVAADLHKRNTQLQADLEQARKDNEKALEKFIADQERAFEEKEKEGLEKLQRERAELEAQLQMHEKSSYFQGQVATTLREELAELELQIKQSEATEEKALAQVMGCHCHRRPSPPPLMPPPPHLLRSHPRAGAHLAEGDAPPRAPRRARVAEAGARRQGA